MAKFVKGEIVVVSFPFSDLSANKRRPALVLANLTGNDVILCQITSQDVKDNYALSLTEKDFESGKLDRESNIRPNRIFTADEKIIAYKIGKIKRSKLTDSHKIIMKLFEESE